MATTIVGWYNVVILSCLVSNEYFNFIVQVYRYHYVDIGTMCVTLCIGRLCPITVYRAVLGVCVVLVLSVIMCSFYWFLDRNHVSRDYYRDFMAILFIMNYAFKLSVAKYIWFCKCAPPWMFPPLDIPFGYWTEHVTFGFLCVMFRFSIGLFYNGVPGFGTDCPTVFGAVN